MAFSIIITRVVGGCLNVVSPQDISYYLSSLWIFPQRDPREYNPAFLVPPLIFQPIEFKIVYILIIEGLGRTQCDESKMKLKIYLGTVFAEFSIHSQLN